MLVGRRPDDASSGVHDDRARAAGAYVDAEEVITRALQSALRGNLDPGGCDPSADGSADDCARQPGGGTNGNGNGGNGGNGNGEDPSSDPNAEDPGQVAPGVDTSSMLTMQLSLPQDDTFGAPVRTTFCTNVSGSLEALPGIR